MREISHDFDHFLLKMIYKEQVGIPSKIPYLYKKQDISLFLSFLNEMLNVQRRYKSVNKRWMPNTYVLNESSDDVCALELFLVVDCSC